MRAEKTFDGIRLLPQTKQENEIIKKVWNATHPKTQIGKIWRKGDVAGWEPSIVLDTRNLRFFVYCGEPANK